MNTSLFDIPASGRLLRKRLKGFLPSSGSRPVRALIGVYHKFMLPVIRLRYPLFGASMMLGVTNRCQCRCAHCGVSAGGEHGQELGREEMLSLIEQAWRLGAGGVYFFGGEPLLSPDILAVVSAAKKLGLFVALDTNGLLLDEKMALALAAAGADRIGVSLDSYEETEHDRLRGVPGAFRAALGAVRACRDAGMEVFFSTYVTGANLRAGGLDKVIALARSFSVRLRVLSPIRAGRWSGGDDISLTGNEIKLLRARLARDVFWESIFCDSPGAPFVCSCLARTYFYVSPCAEVRPCWSVPLAFGNARTEPLERIVRRMWGGRLFFAPGSGADCPVNSGKLREVFGGALPVAVPVPRPAKPVSSPNDPAEWDEWAPHYGGDVDWVEEIHNPDIAELARPAGRRVLDIGCGTGRRARAVFSGAASITAVDSSGGMAAVAAEVLKDLEQASVLRLDIEKEALPAGLRFDAAVAASTMHHVKDAAAALANVKDRLVPGGTLLIVDALSGNPPLTALSYYLEMLALHSPLRLAKAFFKGFLMDTRVARHKRREVHPTFNEFRRRYAEILPGASAEVRHGIFGYLVWKKPE